MSELDQIKEAAKSITASQKAKGFNAEAIHLYKDQDGAVIYARLRMVNAEEDKWIRPLSRDAEGNWTQLKEPTFPNGKPLYNLDRLAKYPDLTVLLVEGEKAADALTKLGLLATTSGGATSAKDANWQALAGRDVIVWPDNDEAGLKYADEVMTKLESVNAKAKLLDIEALKLPPKGDAVEFIQQFTSENGRSPEKADFATLPIKTDVIESDLTHYSEPLEAVALPQNDDEVIAQLASLSEPEYDRVRKEKAKQLGIQLKTLDVLVKGKREEAQADNSLFADIEAWPEPIEPAQLLDEVTSTIQRFIVLDQHQAQAAALWVSACWFIDVIQCAPIALINAPEKACGKTQLLTVMGNLAPRKAQASGISPSALYRVIEAYQPTLFVDEIETVLKDNEDLRGLINAGHTRDSASVIRCTGEDFEPKAFSVWGMKAIAGINAIKLAETVTSRSIVLELRRKRPDESVERLRRAESDLFSTLSAKLARFAEDYSLAVSKARPELIDALGDRENDNWEPLLQIATIAGGHWLNTAIDCALKLSEATTSAKSTANELLEDIQEIFDSRNVIKISTSELITALCEDSEKSWATYNRGKPLSPRQLSSKLKDYGIQSRDMRFAYDGVKKGYEVEQFNDVFSRYLKNDVLSATPLQTNKDGDFDVADENNLSATRNISATPKPAQNRACSVVADKSPILAGVAPTKVIDDVMEF